MGGPVDFSVFSIFDEFPDERPHRGSDRYTEALELVQLADRLGYHTFWAAEHHFHPAGSLPAPPVWLAAASQVTRRIRLGSLVTVLPLHEPVALAEEFALLDRLSSGRLEIAMGTGNTPMEYEGFGLDPETRRAVFPSRMDLFLKALRGEEVGSPRRKVRINVLPVQRPPPPLWIAAGRREAIRHVGRQGFSLAMIPYATVPDLSTLREEIREYRDALPAGVEPRVVAGYHIYAGADPKPAREALQRYLEQRLFSQSAGYLARVKEDPDLSSVDGLVRRGFVMMGSEEGIRRRIQDLEDCGVTEIAGIFDFGGLPFPRIRESLERFARVAEIDGRAPIP